jgi:hypothetical protein
MVWLYFGIEILLNLFPDYSTLKTKNYENKNFI